ncbi:MAG: sulfatase, partial [Planctomycetes bacterium]|nr:sulfatase [Planctomycetota bacterium]
MRPDVGVMHWSRREFLKAAGMSAAALVTPNWAFGQAPSKRPNFIFILMDDMGWMDTGCYGSQYYETPNINRLAAEGVRFTQAYAACPVCSPTRASILTGKYPARLRLTDWIAGHRRPYARLMPPDWTMFMPHEEVTIAEALKEAGYVTASVGKWHLGDKPYAPETQGFDHNIAGGPWGQPANYFSPYKREYPNLADGPAGEYLTDRLTDESLRFIAQSKDRPFFLYFPHYAVHTPIQAKQGLVAKYEAKEKRGQKNAAYAAMVESADESVGRILTKLDELRIADRT